jgi:hypothetical protein
MKDGVEYGNATQWHVKPTVTGANTESTAVSVDVKPTIRAQIQNPLLLSVGVKPTYGRKSRIYCCEYRRGYQNSLNEFVAIGLATAPNPGSRLRTRLSEGYSRY